MDAAQKVRERMRRVSRQSGQTVNQVAEATGLGRRKVYRELEKLREIGHVSRYWAGRKGYIYRKNWAT